MALAAVAGLVAPGVGSSLTWLVTPLVIVLVYTSLRGLAPGEISASAHAIPVALVLVISYVALPVGGTWLAGAVVSGPALLGFAVVLAAPATAGSAIVWTRFSGGDDRVATTGSLVSILLAPVVIPLVSLQLVDVGASVPAGPILRELSTIVLVGGVLAAVIPASAISARTVDRGAMGAILLLIYVSVAGADPSAVTATALLAIVAVSVVVFAVGVGLSIACGRALGLDRRRWLAVCFTASLKNLGIALLIVVPFGEPLAVAAVLGYYVVGQLVGASLADVL